MALKLQVVLSTDDLRKYPFLPEAIERAKNIGITLDDLTGPLLKDIVWRAGEYLRAAINSSELQPPSEDCDEEILTYMTSLILLRIIFDKILIRRFAVIFSKRFYRFLSNEDNSKLIYVLSKIGIRIKMTNDDAFGYNFVVNIFDYIQNIPERRGHWKLAHRIIDRGWVFINKLEAARIGEEALKKMIERVVESLQLESLKIPDEIFNLVEGISKEWSLKLKEIREAWIPASTEIRENAFPPCINSILESVKAGKNVTHSARFVLASFLLSIGLEVDEVLDIFKASPDFNEKIARYQVEHIAGLRGSRKRYSPYKCDNMKTLGLCVADCGVKHPLQYYWLFVRKARATRSGGSRS